MAEKNRASQSMRNRKSAPGIAGSLGLAVLVSSLTFTTASHAQTVVIGGGNDRPILVNIPQTYEHTTPGYNPSVTGPGVSAPGATDYSKSATITYGNEVIKLTPPGTKKSKPAAKSKPKKTTLTKKAPAKPKAKPVQKAAKPAPTPAPKPKAVAKAAPEVKKVAPAPKPAPKPVMAAPKKIAPTPTKMTKPEKVVASPVPKVKTESMAPPPKAVAAKPKAEAMTKAPVPKPAPKQIMPAAPEKPKSQQMAALDKKAIPEIKTDGSVGARQIFFETGETTLPSNATGTLKQLSSSLKGNNDRIQLVAFAEAKNNGTARRLSLGRALAIRSKLMEMGVPNNKIEVRALGKPTDGSPADRVDLKLVTR